MVVAETMLAAVMSGMYHLTDGQEVEENLILSKRRAIAEHDHRDDSSYSGILSMNNLFLYSTFLTICLTVFFWFFREIR